DLEQSMRCQSLRMAYSMRGRWAGEKALSTGWKMRVGTASWGSSIASSMVATPMASTAGASCPVGPEKLQSASATRRASWPYALALIMAHSLIAGAAAGADAPGAGGLGGCVAAWRSVRTLCSRAEREINNRGSVAEVAEDIGCKCSGGSEGCGAVGSAMPQATRSETSAWVRFVTGAACGDEHLREFPN